MAELLKKILVSMHGAFLPKGDYIDESMRQFSESIYSDFDLSHPVEDKLNMKGDVNRLKSDFKKAVKDYKEETVNG